MALIIGVAGLGAYGYAGGAALAAPTAYARSQPTLVPSFPDGLTVLKGFGQFREASGGTVQESSFVLVLYPRETAKDSSAKIEEIRKLYLDRFA